MLKKISLLLLFLIVFYKSESQPFFKRTIGGIGMDEIIDIAKDSLGNIYSTGYFSSPIAQFSAIYLDNTASTNTSDVFISKSAPNGNTIWAKKIGGVNQDKGRSISLDKDGNILVTGTFIGNISFGPGLVLNANGGSLDIFICKYDNNGNFLWATNVGGPLGDEVYDLAVDNSNNVIITGQYKGNANFVSTTATSTLDTTGIEYSFDIFVLKLADNGTLKWLKTGQTEYNDRGTALAVDTSNNIFLTGQFSDTLHFNQTYTNSIYNANFIMKMDSMGNELNFVRFTASSSIANSICVNSNNEVLFCGEFIGNLLFFTSPLQQVTNSFSRKMYIAKFDNNLNYVFCKTLGSTRSVNAKKIAVGTDLNCYVFGEFRCTFSQLSDMYGTGTFNTLGFQDLYVAKFDNNGNEIWQRHLGGKKNDFAHGLVCDNQNNPIIAGSFTDELFYPSQTEILSNSFLDILNVPSHCNDNNYNKYGKMSSLGFVDGFITNAIDTNRQTIDFYLRDGDTTCTRQKLKPCIVNNNVILPFSRMACSPDTINVCDSVKLKANFKVQNFASPDYNTSWIFGSNTINESVLNVTTSGPVILKTSSEDNCYVEYDTIVVNVFPTPPEVLLSDNLGYNTLSPSPTNPIAYCAPPFLNTVITSTPVEPPNTLTWIPSIGANGLTYNVTNETSVIAKVTSPAGCSRSNYILIRVDTLDTDVNGYSLEADTINLCAGSPYNYFLAEANWLPGNAGYDELSVNGYLNGELFTSGFIESEYDVIGGDSAVFPVRITIDSSGVYTFTWEFIRTNQCGSDTDYVTLSHFINVNSGISVSPDIVETCSFQTITLSAISSQPFVWSTPVFPDTVAATITVPGLYGSYVASYSLPPNNLGYAQVCADSAVLIPYNSPDLIAFPQEAVICPGDSVQLTMIFPDAIAYQWYGPNGFMPNYTGNVAYASIPGSYYCTAMNSDSCTVQSNIKPVVPYSTPYLIADPPTNMVCYNEPALLEVLCNDNSLIVWDSPLSGNGTTQIVTEPGVYTCTATSCGITTFCSITITGSSTNVNLSILGPDEIVTCDNESVTLTATAIPGVNIVWSNGSTSPSITVTESGLYYASVTVPEGCTYYSEDVDVEINPIYPPLKIPTQSACYGDTVLLVADTPFPVQWYSDPNGNNIIGTSNEYVLYNVTTNQNLWVQVIENPACPTPIVPVQVVLNTNVSAPVINGNPVMCNFSPVTLSSETGSNIQYFWNGPNNFTSNAPQITVSTTGVYSLRVKRDGCNSMTSFITVTNISAPTPTFTGETTYCSGTNAFFAASSPVGGIWNYLNNNNQLQTGSAVSINNIQTSHAGTYKFFYSNQGCLSDTLEVNIIVNQTNPPPIVSGDTVCYNESASLVANSPFTINWYSNSGGTQLIGTGNNLVLNNITAATTVYAKAEGICPSSLVAAQIVISPDAFAPTISGNVPMCNFSPITLSTQSGTNYLYYWTGPNGFTANTSNAVVSSIGQYTLNVDRGNCLSIPATVNVTNIFAPAPGFLGDTMLCTGDMLQISANSIYPNVNWFNISNNGLLNSGSSINLGPVQLADSGVYSFYYQYSGCISDTLALNITVNQTNAAPILTNDTVCYNATAILFSDSLHPVNWYSNPAGTQFIGTGNHIELSNVINGFTVYAQAMGICPSALSAAQIVMNPAAIAPAIYGDSAMCNFNPITLFTDTNTNYLYYWSGPNSFSANTAYVSVSTVGEYVLNVDRGNCLSFPAYFNLSNITASAPGYIGDTTLCTGDLLQISANSIFPDVQWYNISNSGNVNSGSSINIAVTQLTDAGTYYFFYDYLGCRSDTADVNVYINNMPQVNLDSALTVCFGETIAVNPTYSNCDNLFWVFPNSSIFNSDSLYFASADTLMNGLYTFNAGIMGCFNDTSTIRITVNYTHAPSIANTYNACENQDVLFDILNDNPSTSYHWIGNNNTSFYTYGDTLFRAITIGDSAVYNIVSIANGCISDTATVVLNIQATPMPLVINSNLPACQGETVILWTNSTSEYTAQWNGPGNFSANSDSITLQQSGTALGTFSVYAESSFGCNGPATSQNINLNPLPEIWLGNDTTVCDYTPFVLNVSQSFSSQLWNTNAATEQILVDSSGTYWVQVTDDYGCSNTDSININVLSCNLTLGNVFTPDENGLNDLFYKGGEDLKEFRLIVYDRWGKTVYETSIVGDKWSCNCDSGTYYYVIDAVDLKGKKGSWKGFITLFK